MKSYQCTIWLFLLLTTGGISAQELTPFVVSSSGGFYSNDTGMLSFTIGEMSAVETFTSPVSFLTQGFQQPWDLGTYVTEHPNASFSFGVYPNPSDGNFQLITETEDHAEYVVRIWNVLGTEILQTQFAQYSDVNMLRVDISESAPGMYLLTIAKRENTTDQFVTKIQVIK